MNAAGLIVQGIGYSLLWWATDWRVAVGAFLCIWGYALQRSTFDERVRSVL